ncbi:OLC1v1028029C1 [Oldenlandia corymbosa var. corymbosa]|uniref:Carboxypeptidase n=1 Tax=Oldenlandia corymbosa var. corymbosa TaxID=529605 RepID=A0AAV1CAS7_OLDCO|nr:OLC1v1028029C1 [Oldenlandia corymbosa var. corymbosa]
MATFFLLLICLSSLLLSSRASAELITSLPGQPANSPFKQYSGYIVTDAQHGRALFYYFVEAKAENPSALPLTLWLNGGPGCSSLGFGAFMEHGPFQPANGGQLTSNKYSWNLVSNMLYVESPIGVGFSYSNTSSDYNNWNDAETAQDNLQFIINWFKEFPRYRNSDLYLTGESYAGHYIPQLASLLIEYNKRQNNRPINLKAIALGNPLLDSQISIDNGEFLWSHGLISDEMLTMKKTVCNDSRYFFERVHRNISKECRTMFRNMIAEMGNETDTGDVLAPLCLSPTGTRQTAFMEDFIDAKPSIKDTVGDPCLGDRTYAYLNNPRVQEALHVKTTKLPASWDFCSGPLKYQMEDTAANIIPQLSAIIRENIPILLFSGDQDSKIPLTQTRTIANLVAKDLQLIALENYGPWYDGKQVGGWSQSFGTIKSSNNSTYLTYASVKGAAHEVPFTSPSQALTLFKAFLGGLPPPKKPTSSNLEFLKSMHPKFLGENGDAQHGRALFYHFVEAEAENPLALPLTLWLNGAFVSSSSNSLYILKTLEASAAQDNLQFIINWFKKFPKYRHSDLYLTGESYAGHHIPQLVSLLIEYNKQQKHQPIRLKAIALGNPLLDSQISIDSTEFLWSRRKKIEEVGLEINFNDMLAPICISTTRVLQTTFMGNIGAVDPCNVDRIYSYLNNPRVQKALHVKTTRAPATWEFCLGSGSSSLSQYQREDSAANIIPLLSDILRANIPVLLYSGDQDAKIPITQTRKIANLVAKDLRLTTLGKYGPWVESIVWDTQEQTNTTYSTFASVRGAAHEVAFTSPSQALTLFKAFHGELPPPRSHQQHP